MSQHFRNSGCKVDGQTDVGLSIEWLGQNSACDSSVSTSALLPCVSHTALGFQLEKNSCVIVLHTTC